MTSGLEEIGHGKCQVVEDEISDPHACHRGVALSVTSDFHLCTTDLEEIGQGKCQVA